ncbi:MAG: STAS domain-containing protein [Verrucomicrobiota bacterium]
MSDSSQPTFLVSAYSEPIVVRINGKANYLNCNSFRQFMEQMVRDGKKRIALDFTGCKGMDSTFLGILAGTAIQLRRQKPAGEILTCNLSDRNRELICNLGLQALLTMDAEIPEGANKPCERSADSFAELEDEKVDDACKVLEAHENLLEAEDENEARFQDVISFLKTQVKDDS